MTKSMLMLTIVSNGSETYDVDAQPHNLATMATFLTPQPSVHPPHIPLFFMFFTALSYLVLPSFLSPIIASHDDA